LGIGQKEAWYMANRIRQAWDTREELFAGPVEAHESYFGGKEPYKHESKRLRAGQDTVGKTTVAGVKDRATNKVHAEVIESADAPTLTGLVEGNAESGATVFTDELSAYTPLKGMGYEHGKVKHSVGQHVDGMTHTNGIESFWAMMKRGYHGTYHQVSAEHLHRYVAEFPRSARPAAKDTLAQMSEVMHDGNGQQTTYSELIARGPHAHKMAEELVA